MMTKPTLPHPVSTFVGSSPLITIRPHNVDPLARSILFRPPSRQRRTGTSPRMNVQEVIESVLALLDTSETLDGISAEEEQQNQQQQLKR